MFRSLYPIPWFVVRASIGTVILETSKRSGQRSGIARVLALEALFLAGFALVAVSVIEARAGRSA